MTNSIWKMPDQKPEPNKTIVAKIAQTGFCVDYKTIKGMETLPNFEKWCYIDDLIAQVDKAERLAEENEAMRDEFEVWHGNYECVVEDKERLQKAVDCALEELQRVAEDEDIDWLRAESARTTIDEIKQLIKDGNK